MKFENCLRDVDRQQEKIRTHRPLTTEELRQLREYYRIGLTWSSNALEGNSLTETETKVVIEDGITIGGKPLRDHFEAVGHSEAFDLLNQLAGESKITEADILALHRLFYHRIDEENAGKYRIDRIIVTGTDFAFPPPSRIRILMRRFVADIPALRAERHPVEFAALLHARMVNIHPFADGNGRAARLLMNLALLQAGYPITIIPPVLRADYLETVKAGNREDFVPFINLITCMVYESQKDFLRLLKDLGVGRK
jgi:Fic family protein